MSTKNTIINFIVRIFRVKRVFARLIRDPVRNFHAVSADKFTRSHYRVSEAEFRGSLILTVFSKTESVRHHIVFLHGGAYVAEASPNHKALIEKLVKQALAHVSYIDYPLAPEHSHKETIEVTYEAYKHLVSAHPDHLFFLFGDSAGGGLALVLLQKIRDKKELPVPVKSVLFSPWVDISMTNPALREQAERDLILDLDSLSTAAKKYAGGTDMKAPELSPLYGSMDGLGHLAIFVSKDELLLPDCRLLGEALKRSRSPFEYHEYEHMVHDWIMFNTPESRQALVEIIDFYNEDYT